MERFPQRFLQVWIYGILGHVWYHLRYPAVRFVQVRILFAVMILHYYELAVKFVIITLVNHEE